MSYSLDLRERVVNQAKPGTSRAEIANIFSIGDATVYRWIKSGCKPAKKTGPKTGHKIKKEALILLISECSDAKLTELSRALKVHPSTIS